MNLDSVVKVKLIFDVESSIAEICEDWTDGEIASLLEGDPEELEALRADALDYALETEAEVEEIEIEGREV